MSPCVFLFMCVFTIKQYRTSETDQQSAIYNFNHLQ